MLNQIRSDGALKNSRHRRERNIGDVFLLDGTNVNHTLVKTAVLVVSEVCARESRIRDAGEARTRGEKRLVGCFGSGAALGVAEESPVRPPMEWSEGRGNVRDEQGSIFAWEVFLRVEIRGLTEGGRRSYIHSWLVTSHLVDVGSALLTTALAAPASIDP